MTMSNVAYHKDIIKNVPLTELFDEYQDKTRDGQALEEAMNEAYLAGEIERMFDFAKVLAVISIKIQIIQLEIQRRDEEEALLGPEWVSEVEAALFDDLVNSYLRR